MGSCPSNSLRPGERVRAGESRRAEVLLSCRLEDRGKDWLAEASKNGPSMELLRQYPSAIRTWTQLEKLCHSRLDEFSRGKPRQVPAISTFSLAENAGDFHQELSPQERQVFVSTGGSYHHSGHSGKAAGGKWNHSFDTFLSLFGVLSIIFPFLRPAILVHEITCWLDNHTESIVPL